MSDERLQKWLARSGAAPSRRKAEALIEAGRVTVAGEVATLGTRVPPEAEVLLDGSRVVRSRNLLVLVLHKPAGVLSTTHDPHGRQTVMGLVPAAPGLHPVGRLDLDSEGLLLLSDDGELTLRLTHPRYGHGKRYRVWCEGGTIDESTRRRLLHGVELSDGPARAVQVGAAPGGAWIELGEGRKRQVRRMFDAVGRPVTRLLRTRVGPVDLGDLAPGAWREATPEEREALRYDPSVTDPKA